MTLINEAVASEKPKSALLIRESKKRGRHTGYGRGAINNPAVRLIVE
jgi:hypothetical protein